MNDEGDTLPAMTEQHRGRSTMKLTVKIGDTEFEFDGEATIADLLPALRVVFADANANTAADQAKVNVLVGRIHASTDRLEKQIEAAAPADNPEAEPAEVEP